MDTASKPVLQRNYAYVREALLTKREIALLDVREEDPHAQAHPLFAANFPLSRIELEAYSKLPRRDVSIVTLDNGEGFAERAVHKLLSLGYTDVSVLSDGIQGWLEAGGELFRDVNVPSKAFGELVEARRHTPSFSAQEVKSMIDANADVVIVDARRFDEYQNMSIPTATNVPGAELVLRIRELAPRVETSVIVNCAGRTRSIIGTQSLINAGIPNPVAALRNGTIGWMLAKQQLVREQGRRFGNITETNRLLAETAARNVADRAGVKRATLWDVCDWRNQHSRTCYFFDVRTPEEYLAGHITGFDSAPGGQLVQETEMRAPVRGARIVLADDDGARANMSASWLAQMGWEVYVVDGIDSKDFSETGEALKKLPPLPTVKMITPAVLANWLSDQAQVIVIDVSRSMHYSRQHIPAAWFILRAHLVKDWRNIPKARRYVVTCDTGVLAAFAAPEIAQLVAESNNEISVLEGGTQAWIDAGQPVQTGMTNAASEPVDRYRRPYEGTDNPIAAMQGYLDWEFGLVEQLARDGTHHYHVL